MRGVSGPGVVGAILRLAGVRLPVDSSNQMRVSSQVMPVLSAVVGVNVTSFQTSRRVAAGNPRVRAIVGGS